MRKDEMSQAEASTRVHRQLATMAALEQIILERLDDLVESNLPNAEVVTLLGNMREATRDRGQAVAARLKAIAPDVPLPQTTATGSPLDAVYDAARYPASAALLALHALFTQATVGYAVLMELSFRAADSVEALGPDNTGDLAWEQMRAYVAQAQELARLLPYTVVDELEQEGLECRCPCPTCSLGICGCPLAFRRRLSMARAEAGPIETWPGLRVARPRSGSPAAHAGIQKDDVLVAIDGTEVESIPMLQQMISSHEPGEEIRLEVERGAAERVEIRVVRPQGESRAL